MRKSLGRHFDIDPETILCGNGITELIYLIARTLKPQRVLIPAPTISEFERACLSCCKSQTVHFGLKQENGFSLSPDEFVRAMEDKRPEEEVRDMIFLSNPVNPTGALLPRRDLMKIAEAARSMRSYLVVDESFIDFCPDESILKDAAGNPYLIVLRSMAPFHALGGLRLGYGVFPRQLIAPLKECKEPWTVNSLAQRAAAVAVKDKAYARETFRFIQEEKKLLEKNFKQMGMEVFPSAANFYLVKTERAEEILLQLGRAGILLGDCAHLRGLDASYLRIAVKSHKENAILLRRLAGFFSQAR
jgi:threonine-phosphate decarboxylase